MRQDRPSSISTEELRHLLAGGAPLWLVYAPDHATFSDGHIPGSLSATHDQLLAVLPDGAVLVIYGEHPGTRRAQNLAAALAVSGHTVRWYADGLQAWSATGLPVERPSAG